MGFYEERILPHCIDVVCANTRMQRVRRRALEGLQGTVLEIGFGSGANVPVYPPEVDRVLAVEPSDIAWRIATKRLRMSPATVERIGLDGQSLPVDDASADCVLSTYTLCTIPDVTTALGECRRVLRPGGKLFFLEHGLSDDPDVARRQRRFNAVQRRVAGGCELDRPIDALVIGAGFELERLFRFTLPGPKIANTMYAGVGVKPQ